MRAARLKLWASLVAMTFCGAVHAAEIESATKLVPADVKTRGVLRFVTAPQTPPLTMYAEDNKTFTGLEVEIAREIAERLGLKIEISSGTFESLVTSVQSRRFDFSASSLNDTTERRKVVDFVDYLSGSTFILVRGGNPDNIHSLEDLCGKGVGTLAGSDSEQQLSDLSKTCEQKGKPPLNLAVFKQAGVSDVQVESGRLAATAQSGPRAVFTAQRSQGKMQIVDGVTLFEARKAVMLAKGSPLTPAVKAALESMLADGSYAKMLKKWDLEYLAVKQITINEGE